MIFSTIVNANDAIFVEKNQPAPFAGVLFTEKHAKEIRKDLIELDQKRILVVAKDQEIGSLHKIITLKSEEVNLYKKQNEKLVKYNDSAETMKYVYFGLGVVVTGLAVYAAKGLVK